MTTLETFYLAYEHYKKEFVDNRDVHLFRKGANSRKNPEDFISMISVECNIEEDWILAIEKGLHYITKAIKEDRQFIRNEGEVLPIEKIRRVSKDSISDLSKHSNYITKLPKDPDDNIIPEKLLMIKRENDYSIYENRVVYTTLSYIKDFVSTRLDKIKEATNQYNGTYQIKKKVELGYRTVDVNLSLHDIQNNDPIALKNNDAADKINRLDLILNSVLVLLKTPLMQEVSKAPLVTRPITKTNVLKMNTNFKESLAVFDYVCAYNKPGFEIHEVEKKIFPLTLEQENCYTDIVLLSSFFAYQFNNNITKELHKGYLKEEKRRQDVIDEEVLKRIKELMLEAKNSDKEIGEYLYALEQGYKILEKRVQEAKDELAEQIKRHEEEIAELNQKHEEEIETLNRYHDELVADLQREQQEELMRVEQEKNEAIEQARLDYAQKLEANIEANRQEFKDRIETLENDNNAKSQAIQELNNNVQSLTLEMQNKSETYEKEISELNKEISLLKATALTKKLSGGEEVNLKDFTSQETFDELEKQKQILDEFFEKAWKETKKEIKKKHYNFKSEKKNNGGKE